MAKQMFTLRRAIEMAVVTEELGGKYYQDLAQKFADERTVAEVFEQLAQDEVSHEARFREFLKQLPEEEEIAGREESYHLLRAAAQSEFFDKGAFENLSEIRTSTDALTRALAFEKSTLFFYRSLEDVLGKSPQLGLLIQSEKNHVITIMKVLTTDARFRGLADNW
jgi:rubrerythrin